ncbi:MAG: ThaI family type II restriction endonuclease [Candidatus Cloacimonetes bacterium]|nr:ThaI family type II restriction endonuclease [Candidatus Cloacimonadota bacterium]MBL7149485.1 ThaI family type II restriction endonuclease [Candidatus Cloacimonadota bacterium]
MIQCVKDIFQDKETIIKVQSKLPYLFQLAELESQRAGKIGMEVGVLRERILVSLLIYKFGENNVNTEIPITEHEIDAFLFNKPISIKTKTGTSYSGVKLIWTVDREKVLKFRSNYQPSCDMLFTQIVWDNKGALYYIPKETQIQVLKVLGSDNYIKLPPQGTNPRGVEITSTALESLVKHERTLRIEIDWIKSHIDFNPYEKWVAHWKQN